ncbi:centrosomal protein of 78 kDa [Engraulis encrasicolus]|uniref:centrosomal protein of 78 kDa n=1 Tax=Engraulis encrasicolus TaxID=184585 RepID=UPI002FD2F574
MLDNIHARKQGALDFASFYDYSCAAQGSCPATAVKVHLGKGMLDFNGDHLQLSDWTPILNALSINKHLHHVAIKSTHLSTLGTQGQMKWSARKKIPALHSRSVTLALCRALQKCLSVSDRLQTLHLNGLPLREKDLTALIKGLAKSTSLENLSLAQCPIADKGLEIVCQSVKYSSSIKSLDFSGCNITWQGAEHLTSIIKHQAVRRHGTAWAESLRYRKAEFEGMSGLRRITLNDNILIGDQGAAALATELAEDLWLKAMDLQKCGLSDEGAQSLRQALQSNRCLHVLDIRCNPLVDNSLVKDIITRVLLNTHGQDAQYLWIKPQPMRSSDGQKSRTGRSSTQTRSRRGTSTSKATHVSVIHTRPISTGIPWRSAARAFKKRGATSATPDYSFQGGASVQVTMESDSEAEEGETESQQSLQSQSSSGLSQELVTMSDYNRLKVELEECKLRLEEERNARLKTNSRLVELELENARLRSTNESLSEMVQNPANSALLDDNFLNSIESSFSKFNAFLNLLSQAGLGQLASLVGIDQSDFSFMGQPQMSSTGRRIDGGAGDLEADGTTKPTTSAPPPGPPRSPPASAAPRPAPRNGPSLLAAAPPPRNGPSLLAAAPPPTVLHVGANGERRSPLASPAPEVAPVSSGHASPRSAGSISNGSFSAKLPRPDASSHSGSLHTNGGPKYLSSSHHSPAAVSPAISPTVSPRSIASSTLSSGHNVVFEQYSSHSNGSHSSGPKGLAVAVPFPSGAERGEGGALSLSS